MGRIGGAVYGVAQSADLVLAASRDDCALRAWSKKDGALVLEMKTPNDKKAVSAAVQGNLAAVGTYAGGLVLIDLVTASVLHALQGHTIAVWSVIFDVNEIISGSEDHTVRVWDKISGREILRIDAGALVWSVAAHENLLVAGLRDKTVRVFDRASGGPRHVLTEATGSVNAVAIDAQRMVSGSDDNKVRVYAVPSFQLVRPVLHGAHWGLIYLDLKSKALFVYDPRNALASHSNFTKKLSDCAISLGKVVLGPEGESVLCYGFQGVGNNVDCGIFVMGVISALLTLSDEVDKANEEGQPKSGHSTLDNVRRGIALTFADILNDVFNLVEAKVAGTRDVLVQCFIQDQGNVP
ncbi:WD repeat-containing protein pop2 [Hondaea fermentalgiana]|uniref:WD repeat-containing protein pop2 n=1 Tax=Hondaea fermentalgiana TaxID=2315210 RepID=A0A2R5GQ43_9STRA|nr:WD repeat-containing protein pop2 [Hondaea fermentalgiana]|eukprot:GBG33002.1 WD repeat-containing protein pop2 [Hondaea fermentalgiana]